MQPTTTYYDSEPPTAEDAMRALCVYLTRLHAYGDTLADHLPMSGSVYQASGVTDGYGDACLVSEALDGGTLALSQDLEGTIDGKAPRDGSIGVFVHNYLGFGDCDNSSMVERSNVRAFEEQFEGHPDVIRLTGGFCWEGIGILTTCNDPEVLAFLDALDAYPVADESLWSDMEQDEIWRQWEDYGRTDFKRAIVQWLESTSASAKVLNDHELDEDHISNEVADDLYFNRMCEASGHYPEMSVMDAIFCDSENEDAFESYLDRDEILAAMQTASKA